MEHIYAIYKPKGLTSHDVIDKLRKITGIKKIGHAGTLDPLASGVLVVGITREGTKQLGKIEKTEKEYVAKIKLGETSITDDAEGIKSCNTNHGTCSIEHETYIIKHKTLSIKHINEILKQFIGKIEQVPPIYSAIKINGKPAHRRVRKGQKVILKSRIVVIKNIELISYKYPYIEIKVVCGPGTYIRSLARDIGEKLKIGAYLAELERTRVGEYKIGDAFKLDEFKKYWK